MIDGVMTHRCRIGIVALVALASPASRALEEPPSVGRVAKVETKLFDLVDDPRVNLHHFLLAWAAADAGRWPEWAVPVTEREEDLSSLNPEQRAVWAAAVAVYSQALDRSLVFDRGLIAVRDALAAGAGPDQVAETDRPLMAAIESALPVYRARWWPRQSAENGKWITAVAPLLRDHEAGISRRLVAAYGGTWPPGRIRVDVVAYANALGAYSTGGVLTLSSLDPGNQPPQALEIVFHEASHLDGLEQPLRAAIARAYSALDAPAPDRLWHDFIFFTAGEATRLELAAHGQPGYQHFGSFGVYQHGARWPVELAAFRAAWQPFLASASSDPAARQRALGEVARRLLAAPPAAPAGDDATDRRAGGVPTAAISP